MNKESYTKEEVDEKLWSLAIATNAAFKGLLGHLGVGGSITKEIIGVEKLLYPERGYTMLQTEMTEALQEKGLVQGDIVVISEKLFAISQERIVPFSMILERDPKKINLEERKKMANEIQEMIGVPVNEVDLICSDTYTTTTGKVMATLGVYNPNLVAYEMAVLIKKACGVNIDVIISDTDTGVDVCRTLIGCFSIGATPLGATRGLRIYECMRAALAAEFVRGSNKGIPIVICRPIKRHEYRAGMGEFRGYDGRLNLESEDGIAFEKNAVQKPDN
jgi:F420-0:gamma-glutamyl ligase